MATWNVQGISTKCAEVFDQLQQFDGDLGTLTETKQKGSGNEEFKDYIHFYSGVSKDKRAKCGVSIVVKKSLRKYIRSWKPVNERLMTLEVDLYGHKTVIIAAYAPTEDALAELKETFEEDLSALLDSISQGKEIFQMGDLNGRVGSKRHHTVVGEYGEPTLNDNGRRLISLCDNYNLKIANGFFNHKNIHRYTWRQPTKNQKSIIDYVIVKQKSNLKVLDTRVYRRADCGSNHYMVKARIAPNYVQTTSSNKKNRNNDNNPSYVRYNIASLKDDSTQFLYKLRLSQKLAIDLNQSAERIYDQLKDSLCGAAYEALGEITKRQNASNYWWDEKLENLVATKKHQYNTWLATQHPNDWQKYSKTNREVKAQVKMAKTSAWERKCAEVNSKLGSTRSTEAWKVLKSMRQNVCERVTISPISVQKWETYFRELLMEDRRGNERINYTMEGLDENEYVPPVTADEVFQALKGMKNGKSPGPGGIPIELIKYAPTQVIDILAAIFDKCLKGINEIPQEWKMAPITPIFKKGDKRNCNNYRGISVTGSIGRLYGRIIKSRLEKEIMEIEEQSGFRAGRSCVDNVFCMQQLLEKRTARGRPTHMLFVDLQKAYDTVPIKKLFRILEEKQYSKSLVNAIKQLYHNAKSVVKVGSATTNEILTSKGLRQGCCISPTLFNIYIAEALHEWNRKCASMGINIGEGTLHTLLFADDQIVIAEDEDDMNYMFRKLKEAFEKWDLVINMDKTKYLVAGGNGEDLDTGSDHVDSCDEFKYLGVILSADGSSSKEVANKINTGKRLIGMLNPVLWSNQITKKTKCSIYKTIVESIVTYGSETWGITQNLEKKLTTLQMDFLRRSCRVSRLEHITNEEIMRRMPITRTILDTVEQKRLVWYGHMRRMGDERLPKRIFEWVPQNQNRKRGRPRRTWYQGVQNAMECRGLKEEETLNRDRWRRGTEKHRQM